MLIITPTAAQTLYIIIQFYVTSFCISWHRLLRRTLVHIDLIELFTTMLTLKITVLWLCENRSADCNVLIKDLQYKCATQAGLIVVIQFG
jgi:hypothetical protein